MSKLIPAFQDIRPEELLSMMRYVGGLDYWPVPLRGLYSHQRSIKPTPAALDQSWTELLASSHLHESFCKLDAKQPFKDALATFKRELKPNLPQLIRFINIVLHSMYLYLIELSDPQFTGVSSAKEKKRAIKASNDLLGLIRDGMHYGSQGMNDNYQLAVCLEQFQHFLKNTGTVRRDETLRERRFLKRIIYEFLVAYTDALPHVLFHLYLLVWPGRKNTDENTITHSIEDYIADVKKEIERAKRPPFGRWYSEGS